MTSDHTNATRRHGERVPLALQEAPEVLVDVPDFEHHRVPRTLPSGWTRFEACGRSGANRVRRDRFVAGAVLRGLTRDAA